MIKRAQKSYNQRNAKRNEICLPKKEKGEKRTRIVRVSNFTFVD